MNNLILLGFLFNHLDIGAWNINGIFHSIGRSTLSKLSDINFLSVIKKFDIFVLLVSHTGQVCDPLHIENFWHFITSRQKAIITDTLEVRLYM